MSKQKKEEETILVVEENLPKTIIDDTAVEEVVTQPNEIETLIRRIPTPKSSIHYATRNITNLQGQLNDIVSDSICENGIYKARPDKPIKN